MRLPRSAKLAAVTSAALAVLLVAGCSSSGGGTNSSSTGTSGQKVNLTFWSWVPNMDKIVAIWNKSHPDIQVTFEKQTAGDPELTKLLTASKAGNPPDVAQVEYQKIPTLVANNYLADISSYDNSLQSDFPAGLWKQVTLGGSALYGVPQDAAPLAFFYRTDLFTRYGLTVPTTWTQYAADAEKLHQEAPGVYLGNFSSQDPGLFAGLTQQAGAQWWSTSGNTWSVGINSTASQKVASFWGGLVKNGSIDGSPSWTPAWNKGMNDGTYAGWVSAVWAPGDLESVSASNAGKWEMVALPSWTAGSSVTGSWGGSSTAVMAGSKHQQAAAQFAAWLNTDPTATAALVSDGGVYPADLTAESNVTVPSYFSNQSDFYTLAKTYSTNAAAATWGPDVNVAYSAFTDDFGPAATSKGDFVAALGSVQSAVVADMKKAGFTVSGS